jgi:N6-adenosine-specific RNA methylase IME4
MFSGPILRPDGWPFGDLEPMSFEGLMVDPPYRFELYSAKGAKKSPQAQYKTMTMEEIAALPIGALAASNALIWLWATWPLLPQQIALLPGWGFRYVTGGAWNKRLWGPGYRLRSVCEPFLIGVAGEPKSDGRSAPNFIEETRRKHSRKPEEAYRLCEQMMSEARWIEVFSRTDRKDWTAWGYEAGKFNMDEKAEAT